MNLYTTNTKILYADDDEDDHYLLSESLSVNGINTEVVCVSDGVEALNYLEAESKDSLPSLIVLDMNMPRKDGKQTLGYIKNHPHFKNIPVIILSTSSNRFDREYCTQLGAASYFTKPKHFSGYNAIVKYFMTYVKSKVS